MIDYNQLRVMSLEFRRISSNLLTSTHENADANLVRFKKYIDETTFINNLLTEVMDGITYDFKQCFLVGKGGWSSFKIPADEKVHIKAQYDYISSIIDNNQAILGHAMKYPCSSRKFNDTIQHFLHNAFKPLIDYINDAITKEMTLLEGNKTASMIQNIGNVYGSAVQGNDITSINTTNVNDNEKLLELLKQAVEALTLIEAPEDNKAECQDDIEMVIEQIHSPTPRKSRICNALTRIKQFVREFGMKVGVSVAAKAIISFNWEEMIQLIETYIQRL